MKLGIRQTIVSASVFGGLLVALASFDARVRDRFSELLHGTADPSTWMDRVGTLVDALGTAMQHQSIDNAPLLVFAVVSAVLVLFMFRT